ncbi:MAG: HAMP domain-containing sensor histidine kinase [Acidobacteriota bacterium]
MVHSMIETAIPFYLEILLYVAGTFLYGFLVRELRVRSDVLEGLWPLRFLAAALLAWYAGTLLDQWLVLLLGPLPEASLSGALLDLLRGAGWLLTPPLLLHTMVRLGAAATAAEGQGQRLPWGWRLALLASYGGLAAFALPAYRIAASRSPYLMDATRPVYPVLVLHFAIGLLLSAWIARSLAGRLTAAAPPEAPPRMAAFLRSLSRLLVALQILLTVGLVMDPWSARPSLAEGLLRAAILGALLLPGVLFAFHVQRYNLLRLSLSNRAVRQLLIALSIVLLTMLAGPALGDGEGAAASHQRFVAWGLFVALAWAVLSKVAFEPWLERSPAARAFFGRTVSPQELDRLMAGLQNLDGDRQKLLDSTGVAVSSWLGCEARFLPRVKSTRALWTGVESGGLRGVHRLDRLPEGVAQELDRHGLHAVFALRVEERLVGLLGLSASATGGAHTDGEIEAVRLVMRQLEATLALRAVADRRLAAERRAGEQERLGMLGLVSASLAHEIKNPLSSMKVLAQALREDLAVKDPDGEGIEDLEVIVDQIDRLDRTAREILGFARPKVGERTDLVALVRSAVYVLRAEAKKKAAYLDFDLSIDGLAPEPAAGLEKSAPALEVPGSPGAWQTVVFNLLRNAIDHTDSGGRMSVTLEARGGVVLLRVVNPGRLEPAVRDRLFEPFASGRSEGTGLGMALVARRLDEVGARFRGGSAEGAGGRDAQVTFEVEAALCAETDEQAPASLTSSGESGHEPA